MISKPKEYFNIAQLESIRLVKGGLVPSNLLTIIRFILSIFYLVVLVLHIIFGPDEPVLYVMFLTYLDFYGVASYLFISSYFSLRHFFNKNYLPYRNRHWIFHLSYVFLYELCMTTTFIVTIVYWSILAAGDLKDADSMYLFLSISYHAMNFVFMVSEALLANNPIYLSHFPVVLLIIFLYVPYAFLLHAIYGVWPYDFLDYINNPVQTAVVLVSIIVVTTIYYTIIWFLHRFRDRCLNRTKLSYLS